MKSLRDYALEHNSRHDSSASDLTTSEFGSAHLTTSEFSNRLNYTADIGKAKCNEEEELQPLYLELSSTLNVELVYIILKSITSFSLMNRTLDTLDSAMRKAVHNVEIDEVTGDAKLTLKRIKIRNPGEWQPESVTRLTQVLSSSSNLPTDSSFDDCLVIKCKVEVTYYRMHTMVKTFKNYLTIFDVLNASLSPKYNRNMVFNAGEGAGRSGSFFFFSHDRKFIIKTMTKGELKLFLKILPALAEHHETVPHSLLSKIFGVFTVKRSWQAPVHLMLMENTLRLKNSENLKYVFDLKGSLVDRKVKGETKPSTTLKDINYLMTLKKNPGLIDLTPMNKLVLKDAIRKDVAFLYG